MCSHSHNWSEVIISNYFRKLTVVIGIYWFKQQHLLGGAIQFLLGVERKNGWRINAINGE